MGYFFPYTDQIASADEKLVDLYYVLVNLRTKSDPVEGMKTMIPPDPLESTFGSTSLMEIQNLVMIMMILMKIQNLVMMMMIMIKLKLPRKRNRMNSRKMLYPMMLNSRTSIQIITDMLVLSTRLISKNSI